MTEPDETEIDREFCVICDGPLDGFNQTSCQMCGGAFHIPWSEDSGAPRCGLIGSHDDTLAVVFMCNDCYEGRQ